MRAGHGVKPRARLGAAMMVAIAVVLCAALSPMTVGTRGQHASPEAVVAPRLVDLNIAGADELALLPGIGPATAARIVNDRSERGPFASVDELRRVKGIGPSTLERVRPLATAGEAA